MVMKLKPGEYTRYTILLSSEIAINNRADSNGVIIMIERSIMGHRDDNFIELDFKAIFYTLLHKAWIIIVAGILGAVIAGAYSYYMIEPSYSSTARVYVINRQEENKITYTDLQTGLQLTKDYMILVKSRPVTQQVIHRLGLNLTNESLAGMIHVSTPEDTRILEITVNYSDPDLAKRIVDTVAEISSEQMVNVMEIEKVNVIETGNYPSGPSGPSIRRNALFGGMAGSIVMLVIIFMIYLFNDTMNSSEDIEKYLGITTLGIIPLENGYRKSSKRKRMKEQHIAMQG
jgi:capsular polysaccharide biosynthesis protein